MLKTVKWTQDDVRGRYNANNQGRPFQRNNARGNVVAGNAGGQNRDGNIFKDKMLLMNAHENGAVLDEEQLLFLAGEHATNFDDDVDDLALNVDHVFEADQCDAFDSDVDEAPTTHTMFMVKKPKGKCHDTFVDHMDEYHEVHEMQSDVQHNSVVDFDADYTSDSNIIPVRSVMCERQPRTCCTELNESSVRNDALMLILDEIHESGLVQSRSANKQMLK
ncbi:hypothetical protein Tco_0908902 [Tanacetum coccineum]|uniref:Integrase, catalytic region, zinc finger, CCHC-type, peptidase aspartic, catalytic n=1 Tax=Tanacetum coccineum TaxID=301880 RepID=A0ABQ5CQJ2_9ASTR